MGESKLAVTIRLKRGIMNQLFQLVNVSGPDAESFLQGQLTQDVKKLSGAGSLLAAWCTPKGRVICVLRLLEADNEIGLVMPRDLAEPVVRRLLMYRLRAKVTAEMAGPDWQSLAVATDEDFSALEALALLPDRICNNSRRARGLVSVDTGADPRAVEVYGRTSDFRKCGLNLRQPMTDAARAHALINAGIPTIVAATSERYTPHMLNLDRVGAVSFNKGCYTGQEIVARTEHRGRSKRRLMHYRIDSSAATLDIGDKVLDGDREVGEIVNTAGSDLLAVVPVELQQRTLTVNGLPASPIELPGSTPVSLASES